MKNLGRDIETCLRKLLGDNARSMSIIRTKLKNGARVYRLSGHPELIYRDTDHKVFVHRNRPGEPFERVEVTLENLNDLKDEFGLYSADWEVALLLRGRERSRQDLENALIALGHAVTVRIGGNSNDSWYPASIAVEELSKSAKPGDQFDVATLSGELIAIGEALAPLQKTLDDVSVRLRALGIALTINARKDT
jgi:hypothetical protein